MEISEEVLKIDKKLVTTKRGRSRKDGFKKKFDRFGYMERRNPSSYAKTRPVLRTDSELEDKTGTMRAKLVTAARI